MGWIKINIKYAEFKTEKWFSEIEYNILKKDLQEYPERNIRSTLKLFKFSPIAAILTYIILFLFAIILLGTITMAISYEAGLTIISITVFLILLLFPILLITGAGVSILSYFEAKKKEKKHLENLKKIIMHSNSYKDFLLEYEKLIN